MPIANCLLQTDFRRRLNAAKEAAVSLRIVPKPLGQLLLERDLISEYQLNKALKVQKEKRRLLRQILLKLKYVTEKEIVASFLATQFGYPHLLLSNCEIDPQIIQFIPKKPCLSILCGTGRQDRMRYSPRRWLILLIKQPLRILSILLNARCRLL